MRYFTEMLCIVRRNFEEIQESKMMHILYNKNKPILKMLLLSVVVGLSACQPTSDQANLSKAEKANDTPANTTTLIVAKTIELKPKQNISCDEESCTEYKFQTVETNLSWINDYFKDRIVKADPLPFEAAATNGKPRQENPQNLSQAEVIVRFIGQNKNLATFEMMSYIYQAGAAHGMYHKEYVNFDLNQKKRISFEDLLVDGVQAQLKEQLYNTNSNWLTAHNIEQDKLNISDNFYYGANGIVFVYPLYELASYAEGMSELTLPYQYTQKLIKAQYLPNLPKYGE